MPPKNSKIGPGMLCTFIKTPEGLQPLYALEETEEMEQEQEEIQWPKENPYLTKEAREASFTAETKIAPDIAEMFTAPDVREGFAALGRALGQAGETVGRLLRAFVDCWVATTSCLSQQLSKAVKVQAALKEAPPRVRHLAKHGKKYRTRKKNINRALRDYERSRKRDRP